MAGLNYVMDTALRLGLICQPVKTKPPGQVQKFCGMIYDTRGSPCMRIPRPRSDEPWPCSTSSTDNLGPPTRSADPSRGDWGPAVFGAGHPRKHRGHVPGQPLRGPQPTSPRLGVVTGLTSTSTPCASHPRQCGRTRMVAGRPGTGLRRSLPDRSTWVPSSTPSGTGVGPGPVGTVRASPRRRSQAAADWTCGWGHGASAYTPSPPTGRSCVLSGRCSVGRLERDGAAVECLAVVFLLHRQHGLVRHRPEREVGLRPTPGAHPGDQATGAAARLSRGGRPRPWDDHDRPGHRWAESWYLARCPQPGRPRPPPFPLPGPPPAPTMFFAGASAADPQPTTPAVGVSRPTSPRGRRSDLIGRRTLWCLVPAGGPPRLCRGRPRLGGVPVGQRTSVPRPAGPPARLRSCEQAYSVHWAVC